MDRERIPELVRTNAGEWQRILQGPAALTARPAPDRWSALEYACHVRDVFRLYDERLELMLTRDDPTYPNWDQDATAVEDRYNEQDPPRVAIDLGDAARRLADRFAAVTENEWERTGTRSDGAQFTVDSFARYMLHDPVHHLHDVEKGLASFGG